MRRSFIQSRIRGDEYKARTNALFECINKENTAFLRLFGRNNRELRRITGKSYTTQCNELLEAYGFYTKAESLRLFELNRLCSFNLRYLQAIAIYWGVPLLDLLTVDYSIVENQSRLPIKFAEKLDKRIGKERKATVKLLKEEAEKKVNGESAG